MLSADSVTIQNNEHGRNTIYNYQSKGPVVSDNKDRSKTYEQTMWGAQRPNRVLNADMGGEIRNMTYAKQDGGGLRDLAE